MLNRPFLGIALFLLCAVNGGFVEATQNQEKPFVDGNDLGQKPQRHATTENEQSVSKERANPSCREWKNEACTVCGIDSAIDISVKNKTKTPILLCRDMKPGAAKVVMFTHAEPVIPGVWEVEFGVGYQTATRAECPHQFIASDHPPLRNAYEVGPIGIEAEIPQDGVIQALTCVGLSSARVGAEGKDTAASLRGLKLRVITE